MLNLVKKIKELWIEYKLRYVYAYEISPKTISKRVKDLVHLIELIERGTVINQDKVQKLNNLKKEMYNLDQITENIDFCRLSAERRLTLYYSLLKSQDKLLSSAQTNLASTERLQ